MINPTLDRLLDGVATSLHETVLPELPAGAARNQLVAAIALIRRAAAVGDHVAAYLHADNRDIATVLASVGPSLGLPDPPAVEAGELPSVTESRATNLTLQQQLVDAQRRARTDPTAERARAALRDLYTRMLERESQINTTSWA
jgi:hypothetical protein